MNTFSSLALLLTICQVVIGDAPQTNVQLNIITRSQWGSIPLKTPAKALARNPAPYVVIHHSDTPSCTMRATCQARIRSIQNYHINTKTWKDIGYNFIIGEDGEVYEGRGWGKHGSHSTDYNSKSMGICIIGNYQNREPNAAAINALQNLIAYGVANGKIKEDYTLLGHRQTKSTTCPGNSLYNLIKTWPRWSNKP